MTEILTLTYTGPAERAAELLAARLAAGQSLSLGPAAEDLADRARAALPRARTLAAALSAEPMPAAGALLADGAAGLRFEFVSTGSAQDEALCLNAQSAAIADPLLPFVHLNAPVAPEFAQALARAGFLLCEAADLAAVRALIEAAAQMGPARDPALIALLCAWRDHGIGPGAQLLAQDRAQATARQSATDAARSLAPVPLEVLPAWIDYNGHMTESRYLYACSRVTDSFLRRIGAGLNYIATGYSYYTAETHLRHLRECKLGAHLVGEVQLLGFGPKRVQLLTTLLHEGVAVATLEQMLIHVDMARGRACDAGAEILARLAALPVLPQAERPDWLGRGIRQI